MLVALVPAAGALADDREAELLAAQQRSEAIAALATNPDPFIAELVSKWQPVAAEMGYPAELWVEEFAAALEKASPEDLLAIGSATSYDQVRAILQGRQVPVAGPGGIGIQNLGDLNNDLTFTPVNPPCRIWDTRNVGGTLPSETTKNYLVYGTAAQISAQGGDAAGCPAPKGESVGVAINVTAAVPNSSGHLRVYPYAGAIPLVSFVNFFGKNIANAGIISTCYLCAYDLSVYNFGSVNHLGDVMGYFYPAGNVQKKVTVLQDGYDYPVMTNVNGSFFTGTTVAQFYAGSYGYLSSQTFVGGERIRLDFAAQVYRNSGANNAISGTLSACYQNSSTLALTKMGGYNTDSPFYFPSTGNSQRHTVVGGASITMPAGTYNLGFCAWVDGFGVGGVKDSYDVASPKISVTNIKAQ